MVAVTEPTFPGCVVPVRPIAVLRLRTGEGPEPKILGVPVSDPAWNSEVEGNDWEVEGWGSREEAEEEIRQARQRRRDQ